MTREEVMAAGMRYGSLVFQAPFKPYNLRTGGGLGEERVAVKTTEANVEDQDLLLKTFRLHPSLRQS